jgi:cytidyltransferase-like protein
MPLLEEKELARLEKYQDNISNGSLSTRLFHPLLVYVTSFIPDYVAPNVISLCSALCTLQAAFLCYNHMENKPVSVSIASGVLIFLSWLMDSVDEIHAKKIENDTVLTTFFDSACASVSAVFLPFVICSIMGFQGVMTVWYLCQALQLVILNHHIYGFLNRKLVFYMLTGPGDFIIALCIMIFTRAYFGLSVFLTAYHFLLNLTHSAFGEFEHPVWDESNPEKSMEQVSRAIYSIMMVVTFVRLLMFPAKHSSTRNGLIFCLLYRLVPAGIVTLFDSPVGLVDALCDGLFFSIVTCDLIVAKMAERELHPWILVFAMFSIFSLFAILSSFLLYFGLILSAISTFTRIPLLSVCINVYVDGVYDMCHYGHMKSYERAVKHGTRLFVGICSDEDVMAYKRAPVMTTQERAQVVSHCKYVHKVIPNCPATRGSLTEEWLKTHNIHIVCHGEEYNREDDLWYQHPRRLGMTRILPRTSGVSTSNLIKRIQTRYEQEGEDRPKDISEFTAKLNASPTARKRKS